MEIRGILNITPEPAQRAIRAGNSKAMVTPIKYRMYQNNLIWAIKSLNLSPGHYIHLEAVFFITGEEQGELIEKKPDTDNYVKALKDCLSKAGVLYKQLKRPYKNKKGERITHSNDDQMIASTHSIKIGCGDNPGCIVFKLMSKESYFEQYGDPRELFGKE